MYPAHGAAGVGLAALNDHGFTFQEIATIITRVEAANMWLDGEE